VFRRICRTEALTNKADSFQGPNVVTLPYICQVLGFSDTGLLNNKRNIYSNNTGYSPLNLCFVQFCNLLEVLKEI
jgi:hypothetical protein